MKTKRSTAVFHSFQTSDIGCPGIAVKNPADKPGRQALGPILQALCIAKPVGHYLGECTASVTPRASTTQGSICHFQKSPALNVRIPLPCDFASASGKATGHYLFGGSTSTKEVGLSGGNYRNGLPGLEQACGNGHQPIYLHVLARLGKEPVDASDLQRLAV